MFRLGKSINNSRRGISLIELTVTCVIMVIVMSLVTTLGYRTSLVWKDVGHHRVAVAELSNQLGRLTRLDIQQLEKELGELKASELCQRTLHLPQLSGEIVQSQLGVQLNLQINWKRRYPANSLELSGWLVTNDPVARRSDD